MTNISTSLVRFNGLIGPQYLDPEDKTGGPDGTMKPVTKDVLREMFIQNFPEKQNVSDENVLAAIQTLQNENEEIKLTQAQILEALKGTINTQVTGSLVELYTNKNITLASDANQWFPSFDVSTPYYKIIVTVNTESHFRVHEVWQVYDESDKPQSFSGQIQLLDDTVSFFETDVMKSRSNSMRVRLENKSDSDKIYNIYVLGLQSASEKVEFPELQNVNLSASGVPFYPKVQNVANTNRMAYRISEPKLLDIPTPDGSGQATHPSVIFVANKFRGYSYWMAFTPFPFSDVSHENPSILCSNDGINWEVPTGLTNPIDGPPLEGYYADPSLVYKWDTEELYLYWNQNGISTAKGWMSKSSNGWQWSEPVETSHAFAGSGMEYIKENLFVNTGTNQQPGYAHSKARGIANWDVYYSKDGIDFTKSLDEFDNLSGSHWHASFKKFGDGYHYISSVNRNTEAMARPYDLGLYYGYSPDLQSPLFDSTPLMNIDPQRFPSKKFYASSIIPIEHDKARVYFSGQNLDNSWGIGYFDIALNNPYHFYSQHPFFKTRKRVICDKLEVRSSSLITFYPEGEPTWNIGIPELLLYKEKTLVCINTLKDSEGNKVSVDLEMVERHIVDESTKKLRIGTEQQIFSIPSDDFYEQIITKEELKVLGYRQLDRAGIRVTPSAQPVSGFLSIYLIAQDI